MHVIWPEEIKSLSRIKLRNWHRCIHVYISYTYLLNVTAFNFILNTEDTAQLDTPAVSQIDPVINVAFSFCHSSPTYFTVGGIHGVMNGKKCLCALMFMSNFWRISIDTYKRAAPILYWYLYQYYQNNQWFPPPPPIFPQSLVLNKVFFGNVKTFATMASTQTQ